MSDYNALREKANAIVHYLSENVRTEEGFHLRWFSHDKIKIPGITQLEASGLLVKLDRWGLLETIPAPGYAQGFMYRLKQLTPTQIRQRVDNGLAADIESGLIRVKPDAHPLEALVAEPVET